MEIKKLHIVPKGMMQDAAMSKFNPEFSFENRNIRITANNTNTLMSITNEKGTLALGLNILGETIGSAVLNEYIVLFTTSNTVDRIYRIANLTTVTLLFEGDMNFDKQFPIETLVSFESNSVQKIYFNDSKNQPRYINIAAEHQPTASTGFDFVPTIALQDNVSITKSTLGGLFPGGVLQYAFTMFNSFGAESSLFYVSDLLYTSFEDRAASPEEVVTNSFKLNLTNLDPNFEYVRVYSILRTSWNAMPIAKVVGDYKVNAPQYSVTCVDTGSIGYEIDPYKLLFMYKEAITLGTIVIKDETLFGGNITLKKIARLPDIEAKTGLNIINIDNFSWAYRPSVPIEEQLDNGFYTYLPKSLHNKKGMYTHFKRGQYYRFGIQAQHITGSWTEPLYLGEDIKCTLPFLTKYDQPNRKVELSLNKGVLNLSSEVTDMLLANDYNKLRAVMVIPEPQDRVVVAQGVLANTIGLTYNALVSGSLSESSAGLMADYAFRPQSLTTNFEPQITLPPNGVYFNDILAFGHEQIITNEVALTPTTGTYALSETLPIDVKYIPYIDESILNLLSPEFEYHPEYTSLYSNTKLHIIGLSHVTASYKLGKAEYTEAFGYDFAAFSKVNYALVGDNILNGNLIYGAEQFNRIGNVTATVFNNIPQLIFHADPTIFTGVEAELTYSKFNPRLYSAYNTMFKEDPSLIFDLNPVTISDRDDTSIVIPCATNKAIGNGTINYGKNVEEVLSDKIDEKLTSVYIGYKSNSHAILALKNLIDGHTIPTLPGFRIGTQSSKIFIPKAYQSIPTFAPYRHVKDYLNVTPLILDSSENGQITSPAHYYLPLGELHRDIDLATLYGGNTPERLTEHQWTPAGEPVKLVPNTSTTIEFTNGDVYVRKYDHLKTIPYDEEQKSKMTTVFSFLCETYINLDSRYDRNRYNLDISPRRFTNFGLLNHVYSQDNNYFTSHILDEKLFKNNHFPNQLTWSLGKNPNELIDIWTNINLASIHNLDGTFGKITSLVNFNGNLISIQNKGIASILHNSRVQIQASDGVPIEIANSAKLEGHRYISTQVGSIDKESIKTSKLGLYFADRLNKSLYLFSGEGLRNLSEELGFKIWSSKNLIAGVKTFVNLVSGDVYFHLPTDVLAFSELFNNFSSFFNYEEAYTIFNFKNDLLGITNKGGNSQLYKLNAGKFNYLFDTYYNSSIHYVVAPEPALDKTFNNIEFRADVFEDDIYKEWITFNRLRAWNEYQDTQNYALLPQRNIFKKFRIWRGAIPRHKNSLDRIRNPWINLKLDFIPNTDNDYRFILHDLGIYYTK